jgi:hypothetical protein
VADQRFPNSERGTDDRGADDRGTRMAAGPARPADAKARSKGVIFLLTAEGYTRYDMQTGSGEAPTRRNRQTGQAIFDNSVEFARNLSHELRRGYNLDYDPLEIRYFTSLTDLLGVVPGGDVAGGRWTSAAIVTHATFHPNRQGRKIVPGIWVTPDGVFADDLRAFAADSDPEFSDIRGRFDPTGTLHIFACSGTDADRELACAVRAFFGLTGNVFIPRNSIQIRDGGVLYLKVGDEKYRVFDPTRDLVTITAADCGG